MDSETMRFGFSCVGLVYLVMLMLPNILWTKNQPKGYDKSPMAIPPVGGRR